MMEGLHATRIYYPRDLTKIERERKRDLAELEGVLLAGELEVAGDENEHTGGGTRRLAVDGGDVVLALLERERCELGDDVLDSKDLLTFEGEHGSFLVETGEADTVVVEGRVVVLDEGLSHRIGIHLRHYRENERETETMRRGSPHRTLHDDFGSSASLSYREQAYNQCRRASFSASSSSSPSSTWERDYNLSPSDEPRSGSCSDFYHRPAMSDLLTERNRGLRASRPNAKSKMITYDQQDLLSKFRDAKFFVIKSYSEDNVYKSMKYCVWASTKNGNKKLDAAYREAKTKEVACSVFLLFSVNASAQFCGVAEMVGPVGVEQGIEMINIFNSCEMKSSILDDFSFYEERQRIQDRKARQRALLENLRASSLTSVPTHLASSLHEDYVREMSKSFAEALALQHKLN
ncbi:hypothetical protein F2Q70_00012608 [Brassica cretica]|uniref:YTH domain-containing family protein n=1 Tax=Brassica cretica TaxID=69181 RepID=A0A8S9M185_BRACR|nr:hypothetical protein F2Q70_00012608 [Brassica cretica]